MHMKKNVMIQSFNMVYREMKRIGRRKQTKKPRTYEPIYAFIKNICVYIHIIHG